MNRYMYCLNNTRIVIKFVTSWVDVIKLLKTESSSAALSEHPEVFASAILYKYFVYRAIG